MKKALNLTFFVLLLTNSSIAQVGINEDNSNPDPSAMLDVKSTDKGVLVPRLTTDQREAISGPADGLLVFDATTESFWFHSSGAWTELIDRGNASWKQNGSNIYFNGGKTGIGTSSSSIDRLQVDAGTAEPAFRVRQNGATKLRIHGNGGTSIGVNSTPPADGLLVTGEIHPQGNIITDQNLVIESNGVGTSVELKTNPNSLFLDGAGLFGFSQDVLIMETGTGSNKVEMNSLGLTTSSAEDVLILSSLANSSLSLGNQGITASTSENIVLETTNANGAITIKVGTNEITIEENGGIVINSSGNNLAINTNGGSLTLDSGDGDITLDSGNGNINLNGNNMDFIAAGTFGASSGGGSLTLDSGNGDITLDSGSGDININGDNMDFIATGAFDASSIGPMLFKSTSNTLKLESQAAMNLNSINSSLTAQSATNLILNAGITLDLDGVNNMTLNAPTINLNNGGLGAARKFDTTTGNQFSQTIQTSSSSVLIGN